MNRRSVPWRLALVTILGASAAVCGRGRERPDNAPTREPRTVIIRSEPLRRRPDPSIPNEEPRRSPATSDFGRLIDRLSEPGGYFPSDNLVSNETSYLHVLGALDDTDVRGGAYLGVGPDQNFSYIASIRPAIAFIIDIRRDNLLHQLLFKALFENARNRVEFLCLMLGKPVPEKLTAWDHASLDEIIIYVDTAMASPEVFDAASNRLLATVQRFGVSLSASDMGTIRGIHTIFFDYGLDIRYSNRARGGYGRFPTWRRLLLETDLAGNRRGYLADEKTFRWLKNFEHENHIVPVVGDLAGPHALDAIGREVRNRGLAVSAFYVSNVEQYLTQGPEFGRFARTVATLPYDSNSVIIRSYFARRTPIPQRVPGHISTQLLEHLSSFVDTWSHGGDFTYLDVVTRNAIPLMPEESATVTTGGPGIR